jgi:hypothetical protein
MLRLFTERAFFISFHDTTKLEVVFVSLLNGFRRTRPSRPSGRGWTLQELPHELLKGENNTIETTNVE